ncbi:MAG: TfoX/Sxy family protein [Faecalibacterium sp.]|jgi:TfoX/Sxy family transcriptional regulator of competence genes|nr:TfoX/Sxy family protein [Faecalibacterium sp.]
MASSLDYVEYVCEQIHGTGDVRFRKMFGDYMVYVNDKPLLLVCDNSTYVKMLPQVERLLREAETGTPYDGAKEHYLLDIDDTELARAVIAALEPITPLPKPRRKA